MFKYTIQAYNQTPNVGPVNEINVMVTADTESQAIQVAKTIVQRSNYSVLQVEDLTVHSTTSVRVGDEIRKVPGAADAKKHRWLSKN